jgi:hypothetical protein
MPPASCAQCRASTMRCEHQRDRKRTPSTTLPRALNIPFNQCLCWAKLSQALPSGCTGTGQAGQRPPHLAFAFWENLSKKEKPTEEASSQSQRWWWPENKENRQG